MSTAWQDLQTVTREVLKSLKQHFCFVNNRRILNDFPYKDWQWRETLKQERALFIKKLLCNALLKFSLEIFAPFFNDIIYHRLPTHRCGVHRKYFSCSFLILKSKFWPNVHKGRYGKKLLNEFASFSFLQSFTAWILIFKPK